MTLRLVLFDCDGTLLDSAATIVDAFTTGFREADAEPPTPDEIRAIIGITLPGAVDRLVAGRDADPQKVIAGYRAAYHAAMDRGPDPLFPGVLEMLDAVETDGTLLGIATGKARRGLTRVLEGHGLAHRFVTTHVGDEAASKPAPEMVEQALRATGVDAANAVVIGDTSYDIEMAHNAGARSIAVTWGNHGRAELNAVHPNAVAEAVGELPGLIDGVLARG